MTRVVATYGRLDCAIITRDWGRRGQLGGDNRRGLGSRLGGQPQRDLAVYAGGTPPDGEAGTGCHCEHGLDFWIGREPHWKRPYIASKHGVVGLTKSAALAYARPGSGSTLSARRLSIPHDCPSARHGARAARGPDRSPSIGRLGTPEEVAEAIMCSALRRRPLSRAMRWRWMGLSGPVRQARCLPGSRTQCHPQTNKD